MLPAISIAASGMAAQSERLEAVASAIAAMGATPPAEGTSSGSSGSSVRVGALPVGDPLESMVTMREAELAYRMNAAVIATAGDMLDALLDAIDPPARR